MINSQYAGPEPAYYPFQGRIVDTYPDDAPKIESDHEAYAQVLHLATVGLTIRQISEQLNIPPGEIELFLKLNANKQKKPHWEEKKYCSNNNSSFAPPWECLFVKDEIIVNFYKRW